MHACFLLLRICTWPLLEARAESSLCHRGSLSGWHWRLQSHRLALCMCRALFRQEFYGILKKVLDGLGYLRSTASFLIEALASGRRPSCSQPGSLAVPRDRPRSLTLQDLLGLILLAVGSAFLTEALFLELLDAFYMQMVDFYNQRAFLESVIFTSANYIEILAFVGTSRVTRRIRKSLLKSRCQLFGWCTARSRRVRTLRI